ncbi:MAG TPA: M56 family metallopeptidase, partial [Verrucomicrobiae bacterium]|nr:M56 family metallopeptidase [Verrucomicrobiae bacterium]
MNSLPILENYVNWLLTRSLQAGLLVLVVLLIQFLFRRRLTSRWRFALWWIVIARLLIPFEPQSALSIFNYVRPSVALEGARHNSPARSSRHVVASSKQHAKTVQPVVVARKSENQAEAKDLVPLHEPS